MAVWLLLLLVQMVAVMGLVGPQGRFKSGVVQLAMNLGPQFVTRTKPNTPSLILISGCTGTGKSTFGMEVAIQKGILKCISTDTIRQTLRTVDGTPALHRSSFQGENDPIIDWRETCSVLEKAIDSIVFDCLRRGSSLVLEGVHIVPQRRLIDEWNKAGGFAVGAVLKIPDAETHRKVIFRRGEQTGKGADAQIEKFNRIRAIHDEMVRLGRDTDWLLIEQRPLLAPNPLMMLNEFIEQQEVTKGATGGSQERFL